MSVKQLSKSIIYNIIVKFISVFFGLLSTKWLNSNLSFEENKDLFNIISYLGLIIGFINFGIPTLLFKNLVNSSIKGKKKDIFTTLQIFRLFSFLVGLVIILLSYHFSKVENIHLIILLYISQFILLSDLNFRSITDANKEPWQFSFTDMLGKVLIILSLYFVSFFQFKVNNLFYFTISSIAIYLSMYVLDYIWQGSKVGLGGLDIDFIKKNLKNIFYLSISLIVISIYFTINKLILSYYGFSSQDIVSYSNATKVFENLLIIPSLTAPMLSTLVKEYIHKEKISFLKYIKFIKFQKNSFRLILLEWVIITVLSGIFISIFSYFVGGFILNFISQKESLSQSIFQLFILSLSFIFIFPTSLISHMNILYNGEKYELITTVFFMIFGISTTLILIPLFGILGVSLSLLITYLFDLIFKIIIISKTIYSNA